MMCVLCGGVACLVRVSENKTEFGLCVQHNHYSEKMVHAYLYRKAERDFIKALILGV